MPTRSARHRPRHRARGRLGAFLESRRGQGVVLVALLALLTAAAVALLAERDRPDRSATGGAPPTGATAPPPTAGTTAPPGTGPAGSAPGSSAATPGTPAAALLDWAERELPPGTRLRAEADVRGDLRAAGAPDELVATDRPTGPDDLVLTVTDGEPAAGGRVLTRFGGLTLVDPSPGTPTPEQLDRRRALAEAVLANPTTRAPEEAAAVLRSADVDMRLLSLLAVLTAQEGVGVAAFPRTEGDEGPARTVVLDAVGGEPVGAGEPATEPLRTWLEAQLPPFAPDRVEVTDGGVLLSYRYASDPDALVAEVSP